MDHRPLSSPPMPSNTHRGKDMSPAELKRTLHRLQAFYEQGRASLEKHAGRMKHGSLTKLIASGKSGTAEMQRKARALAMRYSPEEFAEFVACCEQEGFAIGYSHLIRLLSVKDARKRRALESKAIKEHWSLNAMEAAIRRVVGRKLKDWTGRHAMAPVDTHDALFSLSRACQQFVGLSRVLLPDEGKASLLPGGIAAQLRRLAKGMEAFGQGVDRAMKKA